MGGATRIHPVGYLDLCGNGRIGSRENVKPIQEL
jgi:hypothetical protein